MAIQQASESRLIHSLQLLGDKTRFRMFKLLSSNRNLCVSEIASELNISPSAVSQHFRQFELVGLVNKDRDGQRICYVLKSDDALVNELKELTKLG